MKNRKTNLHISQKRTLLIMVFFSLISVFVFLFIGLAIKSDCAQLYSLINSKYEYSVMTAFSVGQDDYISYNAGIYYSLKPDSQSSLNVDVIMQSESSEYTDKVSWKAGKLSDREVAITCGVAKSNNLSAGDKLYSKHIVDATVVEYTIAEILPDAMNLRATKNKSYSKGIIIMGFDANYFDNVTHSNLTYTNASIGDLKEYYPEGIIYRDDEMESIVKQIFPYAVVEILIGVLLCVVLCIFLSKGAEYNFKRQLMLGFEEKRMNGLYKRYCCGVGITSVIISAAFSCVVMAVLEISQITIALVATICLIEILAIVLITFILNKRLWR